MKISALIRLNFQWVKANNKNKHNQDFPGGLVVGILGFHCCSPGSIPGWGTEILQATWWVQKNKII